jgi:hypothetical protein
VGPNGEVFATSHNHYLANATLTTTVATNLITAVQEHYNSGQPVVVINSADEATWRALTGFVALVDPRVTLNANANQPCCEPTTPTSTTATSATTATR